MLEIARVSRASGRVVGCAVTSQVVLAIAGNIGSGKTTLTKRLVARLGYVGLYESTDENPYLADFYADMPRWALATQLRFLAGRVEATRKALDAGASAISDRTCWEDADIFAENLHGRGAMDDRDHETYRIVATQLLDGVRKPDLLVYLRRSVTSCRAQIARRGREYEESIPESYLTDLHARYDAWFQRWSLSEKMLVHAEDHDFLTSDADLERLVSRIAQALPQQRLPFG